MVSAVQFLMMLYSNQVRCGTIDIRTAGSQLCDNKSKVCKQWKHNTDGYSLVSLIWTRKRKLKEIQSFRWSYRTRSPLTNNNFTLKSKPPLMDWVQFWTQNVHAGTE